MACFNAMTSAVLTNFGAAARDEIASLKADVAVLRELLQGQAMAATKQSWGTVLMEGLRTTANAISRVPIPEIISNRTPMEKTLLPVVGGYICWQAYRCGVFGYMKKHAGKVLPGVTFVESVLQKKPRLTYDREAVIKRVNLESRRQGSEESPMTMPPYQCAIGYKDGAEFKVIGYAIRMDENVLVGPDHVLSDDEDMNKQACGKQGIISLRGKDRIILDTDLVMIKLEPKDLSSIGIKQCKIGELPEHGQMAQIVGPRSLGTMGRLLHDTLSFGRVVYEGTTVGGYSGAAYQIGSAVVGDRKSVV